MKPADMEVRKFADGVTGSNVVRLPVGDLNPVRIEPGPYDAVYIGHALVRIFRTPKVRVDFRIVTLGNAFGRVVSRWYRLAEGKRRISAGPNSDLMRDWRTVFGRRPPRHDRIPITALAAIIVRIEVRDVHVDHRQRELTEPNRYSVVDRIVMRVEG